MKKPIKPPTARQADVLRFVCAYIRENNRSPTLMEISEGVGCAKVGAHRHLNRLAQKGLIIKPNNHKWRSITLPEGVSF